MKSYIYFFKKETNLLSQHVVAKMCVHEIAVYTLYKNVLKHTKF